MNECGEEREFKSHDHAGFPSAGCGCDGGIAGTLTRGVFCGRGIATIPTISFARNRYLLGSDYAAEETTTENNNKQLDEGASERCSCGGTKWNLSHWPSCPQFRQPADQRESGEERWCTACGQAESLCEQMKARGTKCCHGCFHVASERCENCDVADYVNCRCPVCGDTAIHPSQRPQPTPIGCPGCAICKNEKGDQPEAAQVRTFDKEEIEKLMREHINNPCPFTPECTDGESLYQHTLRVLADQRKAPAEARTQHPESENGFEQWRELAENEAGDEMPEWLAEMTHFCWAAARAKLLTERDALRETVASLKQRIADLENEIRNPKEE
jgi:hypothetical protein